MLASSIMTRLKRSSRVQRAMQRIGGAMLVGLGVNLALQKN